MSSHPSIFSRRSAARAGLLAFWVVLLAAVLTVHVNPADGLAWRYTEVYHQTLAYVGSACQTIDDLRQECARSVLSAPIRIMAYLHDQTGWSMCSLVLLYNAAYYLLMIGAGARAGWVLTRSTTGAMMFPLIMFAFSHIGMMYWLNFGFNTLTSGIAQSLLIWSLAESLCGNYRLASGLVGALGILHPSYWLLSGPLILYFCWASYSWKSSLISITLYVWPTVILLLVFPQKESVFSVLWNMSPPETDMWWTMVRLRAMHLYLHADQAFDLILLLGGGLLSAFFLKAAYCTETDSRTAGRGLSAKLRCLDYRVFYAAVALLIVWTLFYLIFVHYDVSVFAAMLLPLRMELAPAICLVMGMFAVLFSAALPVRFRLLTGAAVLAMFLFYNSSYEQSATKVALCIVILAAGNDYLQGEKTGTLPRPTAVLLSSVAALGLLVVNRLDLWLNVGEGLGQSLRMAALLSALGIYVWQRFSQNRRAGGMLPWKARLSQLVVPAMVLLALPIFGSNGKWVDYVAPAVSLALAITVLDAPAGREWSEVVASTLARSRTVAMWGMSALAMIVFAAAYCPSPERIRLNLSCQPKNPLADMGHHVDRLVPRDGSILVNPGILLTYYTDRKCSIDLDLLVYFSICPKLTKATYGWLTSLPLATDIKQLARSGLQSRHGPTPANEIPWKFGEFSPDQIRRLAERWSCDYLVTTIEHRLPFEMLYNNGRYALYRIADR